jgi:hypothetical protein
MNQDVLLWNHTHGLHLGLSPRTRPYVPPGKSDPCCDECIGWSYLREAYAEAKAANRLFGGGDILHFYRTQVGGNRFTERGEGIIKWSAEQSPGW